jgi:hypothetical protein
VLTIDSDNAKVIAILDGINRRLRLKAIGLGVLAAMAIGGGAFMIHKKSEPPAAESPPVADTNLVIAHQASTRVTSDDQPPPIGTDAGVVEADATQVAGGSGSSGGRVPSSRPDAGEPAVVAQELRVSVTPAGSEVDFGDGTYVPVTREDGWIARAIDKDVTIRVRNKCCEAEEKLVKAGTPLVEFKLKFKPAQLIVKCPTMVGDKKREITVVVDGRPATVGEKTPVFIDSIVGDKIAIVEFTTSSSKDASLRKNWTQKKRVTAGETLEVACEPPP